MLTNLIELCFAAIYNWFQNLLDAIEATPIKSAAELYNQVKHAFWDPIERIYTAFVAMIQSCFSFADSLCMGVLPLVDSVRQYTKDTMLFGSRLVVEGSYQSALFTLTLFAPIIAMAKQFPLASDLTETLEYILKYLMTEYGEMDPADFDQGEIFELARTPGKKRSGSGTKGKNGERIGFKIALRPDAESIPVD